MNPLLTKKYLGRLSLCAIAGLLAVVSLHAQEAVSTDTTKNKDGDKPVALDSIEVTGSRIKRIDSEGPNPVVAITQSDLEISGYSNIGDALRALPMISGGSLMPAASNNSFTPGASTVNIRGLGNNNVLVLLNGRRAAPLSSPGWDGLQTVFDFNSIPVAAVESVEFLKDGGSAIYGSDAVSGVINIKLRKTYNGFSTNFEIGNAVKGINALEKSFSAVSGITSGKNSIITTVDWKETNSIQDREYSFSRTSDLRARGGPDRRSSATYPAMTYVDSLGGYYTLSAPKAFPTLADFRPRTSADLYDFQANTDQTPDTRNYGFYTRATHGFTDNLSAFTEVSFRRAQSVIKAAPSPIVPNYVEHGDAPDGSLNIPASNPNNPFGEDLYSDWRARLMSAGPRINDVTSDTPRVLVGLDGTIPGSSDWTWETGALYTSNDTTNLNRGSVFDSLYQNALNGVVIGGQTLYANPFGPEDPRITAYYTHDNPNSAKFELSSWDFSTNGTVMQLPAGALGLAVGGEMRRENFENTKTIANITGDIIGGAEGSSVAGQRRVNAAYVELSVPIVAGLQAQLAGRTEHYSDFGTTTKPKIALSYQPFKWLLFRTSFGQSFLAPNLSYLYTSQVTQFSDTGLEDPKRPQDGLRQIQTRSGGNPDLQPEETDTLYAGVTVEPEGVMKGFSFGVDWFQFKQKNLISQLGADYILLHEDQLPGLVVRAAPTGGDTIGSVSYVIDTYRNAAHQTYRGFDMSSRYDLKTASLGWFRIEANATYMPQFVYEGSEWAGTYNQPKWRGTFGTDWHKGNWGAAVFVEYIGRFENYTGVGSVSSQTMVNPQITYSGLWHNTRITLGARNVFDWDPPFDAHSSTGWNANIHDPQKAFVYMRVAKDF